MPVRVGINGFGRIGRNVFRAAQAAERRHRVGRRQRPHRPKTLAHLLKYDSILGPVPGRPSRSTDDGHHRRRQASSRSSPSATRRDLPLGRPRRRRRHRVDRLLHRRARTPPSTSTAGAKKVIISAPAKGEDITVVLGVNFDKYDKDDAPRHLQRVVHDELPRAVRQGRSTTRSASSTA